MWVALVGQLAEALMGGGGVAVRAYSRRDAEARAPNYAQEGCAPGSHGSEEGVDDSDVSNRMAELVTMHARRIDFASRADGLRNPTAERRGDGA